MTSFSQGKGDKFKISHKIYPVAVLLHRRFKFDHVVCAFCDASEKSLDHLFFSFPVLFLTNFGLI